ncbi:MAG: hypothetical protein H0U49_12740 [Parachlamydiaceae bacterium]|nr:hypothetical protein [Parachlamydiaceae bacterium]
MLDALNNLKNPETFKSFFKTEFIDKFNNLQAVSKEDSQPAMLKTDEVKYEYDCEFKCDKPTDLRLFAEIEDSINRQTLMSGSSIKWDKERLIAGKLSKFHAIGGSAVLLETPSHSKISSFYFSVENFYTKIEEMGGQTAGLEFHLDHPFFNIAEPTEISLNTPDGNIVNSLYTARIPYTPSMEAYFNNSTDFLDLCHKMRLTPLWEDTLEPVTPNRGWNWHSRQQNMIIIPNYCYKKLEDFRKDNSNNIQIKDSDKFEGSTSVFSGKGLKGNVIVFDGNADIHKIKTLFLDLKINKTPMEMVEMNGKIFIVDKTDQQLSSLLDFTDERKLMNSSIFNYETQSLPKPDFTSSGAVVLSMNQNNSYTQYSHEILTFLLKGVNVLAYDNAGKGLSTGDNSQSGLKEAVEICGDFLKQKKGFAEDKILFKGQCAGGLPSSEAAKTFPQSHIWIDQSPRNFSGVAADIYAGVIKDKLEENKDDFFKQKFFSILNDASKIINPVVTVASKLILPKFDVIDNLSLNKGSQIYTIGVPDTKGQGGDKLVPDQHKEEIHKYMSTNQKAHYLPMPGATHVTDWWLSPTTHTVAQNVLAELGLSKEIFLPKNDNTIEELVDAKYQLLTGHSFDHNVDHTVSANMDAVKYNFLLNVATEELDKVNLDIEYMEEYISSKNLHSTFKAALDISRNNENKEMTLLFLEKLLTSK